MADNVTNQGVLSQPLGKYFDRISSDYEFSERSYTEQMITLDAAVRSNLRIDRNNRNGVRVPFPLRSHRPSLSSHRR
jgi:hypothetical protein